MSKRATRSNVRIGIYLLNGGGCGGCALEAQAALSARYGAGRRGIVAVESPAHADVLVLCGALPEALRAEVARLVEAMPDPWACVHLGDCAGQGIVAEGEVAVAGCPPSPEEILAAVATAWRSGASCRLAMPEETPSGEGP